MKINILLMIKFAFYRTLLVLVFVVGTNVAFSQDANDVIGVWLVAKRDAKIEIFKRNDKFFGKISWLKEPFDDKGSPVTDENDVEILNMVIMKDFIFDDGEGVDGTVYDAEEGKTYYGSMELDGMNVLKLRGSLDKFGWLGRTEEWTRIEK